MRATPHHSATGRSCVAASLAQPDREHSASSAATTPRPPVAAGSCQPTSVTVPTTAIATPTSLLASLQSHCLHRSRLARLYPHTAELGFDDPLYDPWGADGSDDSDLGCPDDFYLRR